MYLRSRKAVGLKGIFSVEGYENLDFISQSEYRLVLLLMHLAGRPAPIDTCTYGMYYNWFPDGPKAVTTLQERGYLCIPAAEDILNVSTVGEIRSLLREHGVPSLSKYKKQELVSLAVNSIPAQSIETAMKNYPFIPTEKGYIFLRSLYNECLRREADIMVCLCLGKYDAASQVAGGCFARPLDLENESFVRLPNGNDFHIASICPHGNIPSALEAYEIMKLMIGGYDHHEPYEIDEYINRHMDAQNKRLRELIQFDRSAERRKAWYDQAEPLLFADADEVDILNINQSLDQLARYRSLDIGYYRISPSKDESDDELCHTLAWRELPVHRAIIGVNFPPLHHGCRASTASVRRSRS